MAMAPDIQRAGIPVVSMAGGSAITAKIISQLFQVPWPNRLVVPFVLADMKKQGVSKVALLTDSSGYGKDGLAVIQKSAGPAGLTIVAAETFNPGDTDMTAQLTKLKNSGADAVLLWTAGKEGATVLKNRAALKMTQPFYGGSGQARKEFIAGAGADAEGFRFGTGKELVPEAWGTAPNAAVEAEFAKAYKAAYGTDIDIFAGHAYDAFAITAAAIKSVAGELTPAALRDAIEKTAGLVGVGGTFTFSPTDHNGLTDKDLQVYTVKDGTFVIAK
jgi:branched-chain amino acid transport system substrate-binding protein